LEADTNHSAALNDYGSYIAEYGLRFRELLNFKNSYCVWWLFDFTEKSIHSKPVSLFRILRALETFHSMPDFNHIRAAAQVNWIGSASGADLVRSWADLKGLPFESLSAPSRPSLASPRRKK